MDTYPLNKLILTIFIVAMLGTAPGVQAVNDFIYPATVSANATYTLNNSVMTVDDTLIITRTFINNEATPLTCFYFCDNLPNDFNVISHAVTINNSVVNYDFPTPSASSFTNFTEYYFVLDYPGIHGTYDLLVQANDTVVVEYKVTCAIINTYALPLHTFIAHNGTTGIFGYSDSLTVRFDVSLDIDDNQNLPNSFSLEQNYPNPFNPSTIIEFNIPEKSFVTIKVYNTLGQSVATLLEENLPAGNHQTIWNGLTKNDKKAPSGVYLYKLTAQNREISKKMLLLK